MAIGLRRRRVGPRSLPAGASTWRVVMGLGNPGRRYRGTRHNLGYRVVDELARRLGIRLRQRSFHAQWGTGKVGMEELILAKPLTYVNRSGQAASGLLEATGGGAQRLRVIADDVNLEVGQLRLRMKGSAGGHKGLRSIAESTGSHGFARLRVGIGADRPGGEDLADYVLGEFEREEQARLDGIISTAADAVEAVFSEGMAAAMNRFNR